MSLSNCKQCGKLFLKQRTSYCADCQKANEQTYFTVRDFLKCNPRSTMLDVHTGTGIPIAKLIEMNRENYAPYGS